MESRPAQILVLEDEPAFQKVLKHWLSEAGCEVTVASTAVEALHHAREQFFDLVISDYYLPDYPGTDFIKHLRALAGYEAIPVIMVTGKADDLDKPRLQRELQVLVMSKPCKMQRLCDTVLECLSIASCSS